MTKQRINAYSVAPDGVAALLGVEMVRGDGPSTFGRDDLFAAWANFFERVGEGDKCVVLVFDDMQYADPDLLDFLDHLMESARFPLFVMTLGRMGRPQPSWINTLWRNREQLSPFGLSLLAVGLPLAAVLLSGMAMFHMGADVVILAVAAASSTVAIAAALFVSRSIKTGRPWYAWRG